tara:strand:+ start:384 stop:593 length:210 start_codon:yes stop_codon:yes gene_type:complete
MKFKKEFPSKHGYYWYVDNNYPIPMIGFIQQGVLHNNPHTYDSKWASTQKFIRIGDKIEEPNCQDNEIE